MLIVFGRSDLSDVYADMPLSSIAWSHLKISASKDCPHYATVAISDGHDLKYLKNEPEYNSKELAVGMVVAKEQKRSLKVEKENRNYRMEIYNSMYVATFNKTDSKTLAKIAAENAVEDFNKMFEEGK